LVALEGGDVRIEWVPYSAAALVVGAAALSVGAILVPQVGLTSSPVAAVEVRPAGLLAVSLLYAVASVALVLGLPAVLSIFDVRGARAALVGAGFFVVGCFGTAAYAVLLALYRALALEDVVTDGLRELAGDTGLSVILYAWVLGFALGELVLALALVQARRVPRWVPGMLVLHVGLTPLAPVLPEPLVVVVALLVTFAFAALGILANQRTLLR
jgi:hypothetical protein